MHRSPSRRLFALAGLFVLSLLSCGREVTGPDDGSRFGRMADLAVAPSLPGPMSVVDGSGSVVPFNRVRVILQRTNGEEILSRIIDFPATATEVPLSLEFPLPPEAPRDGLPLLLLLRYLNVAGDTVFAGGPVQVVARPRTDDPAPQPVPVELQWVGPGSEAVRVEIAPATDSVLSGTSTTFTAVAFDALDAVVQGAPVVFSTPDPTIASLSAPGSGSVTWLAVRGRARVIASLPSGEADTALVDVALPASVLTVVSGNTQSALVGGALSAPLVLRVEASDAVPVAGIPVTFTVATGGGALEILNGTSDANGEVSAAWSLGSVAGAQTVTATFPGLAAPVTLTATATAEVLSGLRTWTGGTDAAWSNPTNWENGLVPTSLDTVRLTAAATFDPVLTLADSVVISGLTVEDGATIAIGDAALVVVGSLTAPATPSITVGLDGGLGLLGTTGTVQGTLPTFFFGGGAYTLSGALTVAGNLTITNGTFTVDAFPVTVQGDFLTGGSGVLAMLPGSVMTVNGDAFFAGGSTAGYLSGGRLNIGGDFVQASGTSPSSFSADAGHETWFTSAALQSIQFLTPGTGPTLSHFGTLYSSQAFGGSIDLGSDVWVDGALETGVAITAKRFTGVGTTLFSRGADIDAAGIQFEGVQWNLLDGAPVVGLQAITFTAMNATVTQWRVARAGGSFTVPGLVFQTALDGGLYLELEDTAPLDQDVLTLDVTGVTPEANEGGLSQLGGAQVIGWATTVAFRWTGTTSTDWETGSNWSSGTVPTVADSVDIVAGTPFAPTLAGTGTRQIRTITVRAGATLTLSSPAILSVGGSVDVAPTGAIAGDGRLYLSSPTGGNVRGTLPTTWVMGGSFALTGNTTVNGNFESYGEEFVAGVPTPGDLAVGNFDLTITNGLFIGSEGFFTMTGTGTVDVGTYANFFGKSSVGRLTNGVLRVRGDFDQIYSIPGSEEELSFSASGNHVVEIAGTGFQRIRFDSPDSALSGTCTLSCFANLRVVKPAGSGGVLFTAGTKALGDMLIEADSVSAPGVQLVAGGMMQFTTPVLRARMVAYRDTLIQTAVTTAVDSVVAWGLDTPLSTIPGVPTVVQGTHRIRGTHASRIDVAGMLDVDGPARIAGNLRTLGGGRLRMLDAADSLNVDSTATFSGGPTSGELTAGVLRVGGNFTQSVNAGAFGATGTHRTRLYNGCAFCDGLFLNIADNTTTTFGALTVEGGFWSVTGTGRASGDIIIAGGTIEGGTSGGLVTTANFTAGAGLQVTLAELDVGGTLSVPGTYAVGTTVFTGTGQIVPPLAYQNVQVLGTAAMQETMTIADSLLVSGGELSVGGAALAPLVTVTNGFRTVSGGRLRMEEIGATLLVQNGFATFAGGSTAGLLTGGRLDLFGGGFQQGGGAADAYAASPGHETRFLGFNGHTASFANPGTGPLTSHFGDLEVALGQEVTAVTLLSDLYAVGTLRTGDNFQRRLESAVPRRVFSNGANVTTISFSNVSWTIGDGQAVTALDAITFENMDPTAEQLRIDRATGTVPLTTPTFVTRPTSGRYVSVRDTDGSGDLVLAVTAATPISHGGYAVAENNAQITGWTEAGLYSWNAGGGDWNNPLAWSPQLVPGPADIALIPSNANGVPTVASGDTARVGVLRHEHFTPLTLLGHLMVRDSLGVSGSPPACDGGGVILNDPSGGDIPFRLESASCTLDVVNGTARPTWVFSQAAAVRVAGDGLLRLNGSQFVTGDFSTSGRGRLQMDVGSDSLVVSGSAIFSGESTDGLLTAGTLIVNLGFQQSAAVSPSSFRASGGHVTLFEGSTQSTISMASAGAGTSRFGTMWVNKAAGIPVNIGGAGAWFDGSVLINQGNFTVFGPAVVNIVGSLNAASVGSIVTVDTGAQLTTAGCSGSGTFTGAGTYVGAGCP